MCEKSRRIGLSWADAADSALEAGKADGASTFYIGYNKDMAEQYIVDVASWARAFNLAASAMEETIFEDDEDKSILAFRVRFASGCQVLALSSRPTNLRSKGKPKDRIRIDEAAFHDDLEALLKAAIAVKMWGGRLAIWSTHDGVDNPFNQLVEEIRDGKKPYSLHRYTLDDALADGLYKRICLVQGIEWSVEGEFEWRKQLYLEYGVLASEELDCVPFKAESGKLFNRNWFEVVDSVPVSRDIRFWDLAATAQDVATGSSFYSASQKWSKVGSIYYIKHVFWEQAGADTADDSMVGVAGQDGRACKVRWELEGGAAAIRYEKALKDKLKGYDAKGVRPLGDKVTRAIPWASEAKRGNIKILRATWNDQFLDAVHAFDGKKRPLINDIVDSGSGAYAVLSEGVDTASLMQNVL